MKKYFVLAAAFIFSCTSNIESPDSVLEKYLSLNKSSSSGGYQGGVSSSSIGGNPSPNVSSSSSVGGGSSPSGVSSSSVGGNPNTESYELLYDPYFEKGIRNEPDTKLGWNSYSKTGSLNLASNTSGNYVHFTPIPTPRPNNNYPNDTTKDWHLQINQNDIINYRSGFSYHLQVDGKAVSANTDSIVFALIRCWYEDKVVGDKTEKERKCDDNRDYMNKKISFTTNYSDYIHDWTYCGTDNPNASFVVSGGLAKTAFDIYHVSIEAKPCSTANPCCGIQ